MKKLSKRIKDAKDWVIENPEKLVYGIAWVVTIGTGIVMYKLYLKDTGNVKLPNISISELVASSNAVEDTSVDIIALGDIAINKAGIIGEKILENHPELSPESLIDYSIVYSTDAFKD